MLKAISLGIGAFLLMLGIFLHCIDGYTIKTHVRATATAPFDPPPAEMAVVQVNPPPWKPWAYIGAGLVMILWTITLPQKMSQK